MTVGFLRNNMISLFKKIQKAKTDFLLFVFAIATITGCDKNIEMIPASAVLSLPSSTGRNYETVFNDSGKIQLVLITPLLEQYENVEEPYLEFREGINVWFHDGNPEPVGSVTAKYAKYIDSKRLWELRDSVVVINEDNEKLETELLFWNQQKDLIYTERFVKFTTEDQVIQGTGFESDSRLTNREIRRISGVIYIDRTEDE